MVVVCSSGSRVGTPSVMVSAHAAPTISAASSPAPVRGVLGGLGGAARDHGPLTPGIGAALVGAGVIATGWCLRRRARPHRR
ncbi:hypothetical protein [Streptomyces sp. MMG1121]|uniref:hypothetical protein n=1 Tax=Streptomyces sp. MMG1121 TaxID=1415544 RepID=UPI0006AED316|nr:hypothetical protein [Streptomyces sp. MMG1121]